MTKDPRQTQLALACRYLSGPAMAAREAVRAEVCDLLDTLPVFPGIVAAVAGADDLELLEAFETRHGTAAWKDFEFFDAAKVEALEAMNLSRQVLFAVYARALTARPQAIDPCYTSILALACKVESRPFVGALLATKTPEKRRILEILRDGRIIEAQAFRREARLYLQSLSQLTLDATEAMSISIDMAAAGQARSFALLAKKGLAVEVPDTLIRSCSSQIIKKMNAGLSSNHGRLRLMQRLPDLRALMRPAGKRLEQNIEAALAT